MELFLIALAASTIGGICGIGGGIIIKPLLDLTGLVGVAEASFLSSCTVFCMALYNVASSFRSGNKAIDVRSSTPLALGAIAGGMLGSSIFTALCNAFPQNTVAGGAQSLCLMLTLITLVYTFCKGRLRPLNIQHTLAFVCIGLALGAVSSFLGIGGGPFNILVLGYFLGMETKAAVENSLYIILFGQASNLLSTVILGEIPAVELTALVLMALGGIGGGIIGRRCKKRLSGPTVDKLFVALLCVIICICAGNMIKFLG